MTAAATKAVASLSSSSQPLSLQPKAGATLRERTERVRNLAHKLHDAAKVAQRAGYMRTLNTLSSVAGGACATVYGYCTSNTALTAAGVGMAATGTLSLLEIFTLNKDGEKLEALLRDTEANADILKELVAADEESYAIIATSLQGIKSSVETLNERMGEIQNVSHNASEHVDTLKGEALDHQAKASALFQETETFFDRSRTEIDKANEILKRMFKELEQISTLAKSKEGSNAERLALFAQKADLLSKECTAGIVALGIAMKSIHLGQEKMQTGFVEMQSAHFSAGRALEAAENALKDISRKAQLDTSVIQDLETVQNETATLQARNSDKKGICDNILDTMAEAREAIPSYLTMSNIFALATTPAVAPVVAPVVTLLVPGVTVPVLTGLAIKTVVHNRLSIGDRIYVWIHGKPREKVEADFVLCDTICSKVFFCFDLISSGWRKWFDKEFKGSHTQGDILIDLGTDTPFKLRFHLGRKKIVRDKELQDLKKEMQAALKAGKLAKSDCASILNMLTMPQERFGNRAIASQKSASFFGEIKRSIGVKS